jgi:hypothetical protein
MPKPAGRCVHCLRYTDKKTRDHVFPDSWYPDSTPTTIQRWTVPGCPLCNRKFGELETNMLGRLALCFDPESEATSGLADKVLRSLGLDAGKDEPDKEHRDNRRAKLRSELLPHSYVAGRPEAIVGNLAPLPGTPEAEQVVIIIPWASFAMMAEKIVRGCEYKVNGKRYIEHSYGVRILKGDSNMMTPQFIVPGASSNFEVISFGPGCRIVRAFLPENRHIATYHLMIWELLFFDVLINTEEFFASEIDPFVKSADGILPPDGYGTMTVPPYLREFQEEE